MSEHRTLRLRLIAGILAVIFIAASCGSDDSSSPETSVDTTDAAETAETEDVEPTETEDVESGETTSGILAGVEAAQWADNVTIELSDGSFRFVSDGLPSHELPDQFLVPNDGNMPPFNGDDIEGEFYSANTEELITESPLDVEITLNPVYSEEVTDTSLSTIGVMISGAQLFNDYEDQTRENIALDDNLSLDGAFFIDSCNGHPLASGASYHYHGVPYCITDDVDVAGAHSTIIGVLLDGFPVYGPQDEAGVIITNADLDECSGHDGPTPEFPNGIYHYHLTEDSNPYSIDCFHGEIDYGGGEGGPGGGGGGEGGGEGGPGGGDGGPGGGGPPDFNEAAATLGVDAGDLESALGQPPFDFDAAAATLGVTAAALEAALPAPPGGGGGGGAPPGDGGGGGAPPGDGDGGPPAAGQEPADETPEAAVETDTSTDEFAERSAVILSAGWSDNVTIGIDGTTASFQSDGLPSHEYLDTYLADGRDGKYVAGGVDSYNANFTFPVVPTLAASPTETGNGTIGVAISGAVFFDPYEGDGSDTIANNDNETIEGVPFIDACGGHPLPNASSYHYHGIPFCITDAIDTDGQHSAIVGYLFDGFGIYGPQDEGGAEPTDLDECLGHTGPTPEFAGDTYHYHVSANANYISECLMGVS